MSGFNNWDSIMEPLSESTYWSQIRNAASKRISADLRERYGPDHGFGISSSDINHIIYGVAKMISEEHRTPESVLLAFLVSAS